MITNWDTWLGVSSNFNLFIGILSAVAIISAAAYTIKLSLIGKKDEYSLQIRLQVTNNMFGTLMLLFIIFAFLMPNEIEHYKQIIFTSIPITALVGAISAGYYYIRDFKR